MKSPSRSGSSSSSPSPSPSTSPSPAPSSPQRRRRRAVSGERQHDTGVRVGTRVHVGSLAMATSIRDLREDFGRFGDILDLWMARTHPCFAFIVFRHRGDALRAIKQMDGETINSRRIRVTMARPRTKGTRSGAFNPSLRCYQCGKRGHFSRDCRAHRWSSAGHRATRLREREERHRSKHGSPRRSKRRDSSNHRTARP